MAILHLTLLILAMVCFLSAALDIKLRINLLPLGLLFWLVAQFLRAI